ncbi:hypothetical protein [Microvirga lenta]|uniref:hypothetical protein n=1 Tax=Microvirga lenta TaxID=2881337 RepID=UPI001CFF58AA|nr:hypothetical protein [Microvirga lenta]MCB5177591.1 hypothetical protein [Microvirga lenta]
MSLKDSEGFVCPSCAQSDEFHIRCNPAWSKVYSTGGDDYEWEDFEGHEYGPTSGAECPRCYWKGKVRDLTVWQDPQSTNPGFPRPGNQHGYQCPGCGSDEELAIRAEIWTALEPGGSDTEGDTPDHDHGWGDDADAACMKCGWQGKVVDLTGPAAPAPVQTPPPPSPTPTPSRKVHVLIFHGDEEIRSVRVFESKTDAIAGRHEIVAARWSDLMGDEEMPVDPQEAFQRLDGEARSEGLCIQLKECSLEAQS